MSCNTSGSLSVRTVVIGICMGHELHDASAIPELPIQ